MPKKSFATLNPVINYRKLILNFREDLQNTSAGTDINSPLLQIFLGLNNILERNNKMSNIIYLASYDKELTNTIPH